MWAFLAACVDFLHALLMAAWVCGLPLLFCHTRPSLTRIYGIYAVVFIVISQVSHWLLGECFLTTVARWCATSSPVPESDEWFTVRVSQAIFHLAPSHRAVVWVSEGLILVTAIGVLRSQRVWRGVSRTVRSMGHPR